MTHDPHSTAGAAELRRRAEQRVRARPSKLTRARIEADAQRLVHELQVHQVELEMQNSELHEARARLESMVERYTNLYDFAPVGFFTVTVDGRIRLANLMGASLLGLERSRLIGRPLAMHVRAESRPVLDAFLARVFAGDTKQSCEVTLLTADRSQRTVQIDAEREGSQPECRAVMMDITERKRAEAAQRRSEALASAIAEANREIARRRIVEATLRQNDRAQRRLVAEALRLHVQLRHVTRQILTAQEEERKLISRELHDEIAQILAAINVQLATLANTASVRPGDLRKQVSRTQILVEKSITAVHRYARELRPALLDDLGLIPALRSFIRDLPGRKGLHVRFTAFAGVEAMDNTRRTVLYRIAQESLTNVTRHAHARQVTVRITKIPNAARITIHDDGRSFPVDRILTSNTRKRLGLLGMRERVGMVGGVFTIESRRGHGTTVRADVPFRPPPPRRLKLHGART